MYGVGAGFQYATYVPIEWIGYEFICIEKLF